MYTATVFYNDPSFQPETVRYDDYEYNSYGTMIIFHRRNAGDILVPTFNVRIVKMSE